MKVFLVLRVLPRANERLVFPSSLLLLLVDFESVANPDKIPFVTEFELGICECECELKQHQSASSQLEHDNSHHSSLTSRHHTPTHSHFIPLHRGNNTTRQPQRSWFRSHSHLLPKIEVPSCSGGEILIAGVIQYYSVLLSNFPKSCQG